jgi:hypothetical protein
MITVTSVEAKISRRYWRDVYRKQKKTSQLIRLNLRAGLFGARDLGLRQAKRSDYERVLRKTMS